MRSLCRLRPDGRDIPDLGALVKEGESILDGVGFGFAIGGISLQRPKSEVLWLLGQIVRIYSEKESERL